MVLGYDVVLVAHIDSSKLTVFLYSDNILLLYTVSQQVNIKIFQGFHDNCYYSSN